MLVIESTIKGGQVSSAIVAGNASFYQDVLSKIGAKNVVESSIRYPKISAEFFYEKNIDTVVLLFPENFTGEDELRKAWKKTLKGRETKITSIKNNLVLTPGPRVLAILDIIAEQVYGSAPYAVD
jgi:ABC-type Fe3+-hydroxamate transport system substrate-binding protein